MKLTTMNGYDLFEVISALQKEIRRGHHEDAMFWALELAPKYSGYLWNRLIVIVNEDIGLASPETIMLIDVLRRQFESVLKTKNAGGWRMILANAILAMCEAKKTRLADDFMYVIAGQRDHEGVLLDIPDYALDMHTRRGKAKGRSHVHFMTEGTKLYNEDKLMNDYKRKATTMRKKYGRLKKARPEKGARDAQGSLL